MKKLIIFLLFISGVLLAQNDPFGLAIPSNPTFTSATITTATIATANITTANFTGQANFLKGTGTVSAGAVTINKQICIITFTASGSAIGDTFVLTNSLITASSHFLCTVENPNLEFSGLGGNHVQFCNPIIIGGTTITLAISGASLLTNLNPETVTIIVEVLN